MEIIQQISAIDLLIKHLDQVDKFCLIQTELLVHVPELYHSMDLLVLFKLIDHQVLSKEKDQLVETVPTIERDPTVTIDPFKITIDQQPL